MSLSGDLAFWEVVLGGAVRLATPVAIAALGELIAERGGIINLGIDGIMTAGAFVAVVVASLAGWQAGLLAALAVGALFGGVVAACVLAGRANQIVVGIAVAMIGAGLTSCLFELWQPSGQIGRLVPMVPDLRWPFLERLAVIGAVFRTQTWCVPIGLLILLAMHLTLNRTRAGLALRAVGDDPDGAAMRGIDVVRVRTCCLMAAGALAGLAGSTISLGFVGSFSDGMIAGRGYVAIAVVIIGRWRPLGVVLGAVLFASFDSLGLQAQVSLASVPNELFAALPYAMMLLVLVASNSRQTAPRSLGKALPNDV